MHEYAIVAALVDQVGDLARARGASRVHRVEIDIGELAGVEVALLRTAYETFRARTICEDVPLAIRFVEARWTCPRCELTIPRGARLRCPECERPARLAEGDEILLRRVEMEVSHV